MGGTASCVAQEYVDRPLLLGGYKFDLRLYVLVTSCVPLRVHIFRDGIARLCAEKYHSARTGEGFGSADGDWRFRHLTNYAINKQHPDFSVAEDGTKRRLGAVLDELASQGHDVALLWGEIQQVAVKALIAVQPTLAQAYASCRPGPDVHPFSCFELLGLDLLVDERGRPWLLEVNHSPSLACDTTLDRDLKDALLADTMLLCSFSAAEAQLLRRANRPSSGGGARARPPAAEEARPPPARRRASNTVEAPTAESRRQQLPSQQGPSALPATGFSRLTSRHGRPSSFSGRGGSSADMAPTPALLGRVSAHLAFRRSSIASSATMQTTRTDGGGSSQLPGFKDVHERRRVADANNAELIRLRMQYEEANAGRFELIHPSDDPKLQSLYDLLHSTAQRAHAEASGSRVVPPILGVGGGFESDWLQMFKAARIGARVAKVPQPQPTAAELEAFQQTQRSAAHPKQHGAAAPAPVPVPVPATCETGGEQTADS